nr:unnamed protein product [Spirometra erinaceieuropaei]
MWDSVHSTALGVLSRAHSQHQDWFDDKDAAINNLFVEKIRLHRADLGCLTDANKAAFHQCGRLTRQRLRGMQDFCMARKAKEIQGYASRSVSKDFMDEIKVICGPSTRSDGLTFLTEKSQILKRWAEHFRSFLNRPSTISDAVIDRFSKVEINIVLDLPPSSQKPFALCHNSLAGNC